MTNDGRARERVDESVVQRAESLCRKKLRAA